MLNGYIWNIKNSNIALEGLQQSKKLHKLVNTIRSTQLKMYRKPLVGARILIAQENQQRSTKRTRLHLLVYFNSIKGIVIPTWAGRHFQIGCCGPYKNNNI